MTINANPDTGSRFDGWTGPCYSTGVNYDYWGTPTYWCQTIWIGQGGWDFEAFVATFTKN